MYSVFTFCPTGRSIFFYTYVDHSILCSGSGNRILRQRFCVTLFNTSVDPQLGEQAKTKVVQSKFFSPPWRHHITHGKHLAIDVTVTPRGQTSLVLRSYKASSLAATFAENRELSTLENNC